MCGSVRLAPFLEHIMNVQSTLISYHKMTTVRKWVRRTVPFLSQNLQCVVVESQVLQNLAFTLSRSQMLTFCAFGKRLALNRDACPSVYHILQNRFWHSRISSLLFDLVSFSEISSTVTKGNINPLQNSYLGFSYLYICNVFWPQIS